jgi:putative membrane protein
MAKLKGVIAGAVGGLAGAALMGPLHTAAAKLTKQKPPRGEDATEKVANTVVKKFTGRKLGRSAKPKGGQIVHFAFGAGMGALYGLLAERFSSVTAGSGALFGMAVYAGAHGLAVPALDLAPSPLEKAPAQEGTELASHIAYGLVTDAVRRVLTKLGSR